MNHAKNLLALLTISARQGGLDAIDGILRIAERVPDAWLDETERPVYHAVRTLAESGTAPTIPALRRALPAVPAAYWATLTTEDSDAHEALRAFGDEVQRQRALALAEQLRAGAQGGVRAEELQELALRFAETARVTSARAVEGGALNVTERRRRLLAGGTRGGITTPWDALTDALGGHLETEGEGCMTAVLAYTGVGKSAFWYQMAMHAAREGHWVATFAGESSNIAVKDNMVRLLSNIPKRQWPRMTPAQLAACEATEAELDGLPGKQFFYDMSLGIPMIREVVLQITQQLEEARANGSAPPHARLLFGIDNIDHVLPDSGTGSVGRERERQEWQVLESATRQLYDIARRRGAHCVILSQATPDAFKRGRPPERTDFSRSKLIASHCPNIIGLYRPTTEELAAQFEAAVLISKSRHGEDGVMLSAEGDAFTGRWRVGA